jgi:hypothetical protein
MHNIDRTQPETWETSGFGPTTFGYEAGGPGGYGQYEAEAGGPGGYGQYEAEAGGPGGYGQAGYGEMEMESPLGEEMELELTAELLEINSEQELDHFIGGLISAASRIVGNIIRSPMGNMLGGTLKDLAQQALPMIGGAVGSVIAPGAGTAIGSSLGSMASRAFELETEGLSGEDRDFEMARRFVRFASAAAQEVATMPPNIPPPVAVPQAIQAAAQQFAPGLLYTPLPPPAHGAANGRGQMPGMGLSGQPGQMPGMGLSGQPGQARTGRWIRRGPHILLLGVYRRPRM